MLKEAIVTKRVDILKVGDEARKDLVALQIRRVLARNYFQAKFVLLCALKNLAFMISIEGLLSIKSRVTKMAESYNLGFHDSGEALLV